MFAVAGCSRSLGVLGVFPQTDRHMPALILLLFSLFLLCFFFVFSWIPESVFFLAVSLDSGVTVLRLLPLLLLRVLLFEQ